MKIVTYAGAALVLSCFVPENAQSEELVSRGVVRSLAEVTISAEYSARINSMPILEGQEFKKGELLIAFDCRRMEAEAAASRANARAQGLVYGNNRKLLERGAIGANEVKVSQAQFEKTQAEAAAADVRISGCEFRAPFDGRVVQRIEIGRASCRERV